MKHKANHHYICDFCVKHFKTESGFLKHNCEQMERHEYLKGIKGQLAFDLYKRWMKFSGRRSPSSDTFLHSQYYKSFVKFTKFAQQVRVPDFDSYIRLMVRKKYPPSMWCEEPVYDIYLQFIDKQLTPTQQADITIDTLCKYADAAECEVNELFEVLTPEEVIQLFRQRKLTPWLLLNSLVFKQFYTNDLNSNQRVILETIIRPQYWAKQFNSNPKDVETMRLFVKELNL